MSKNLKGELLSDLNVTHELTTDNERDNSGKGNANLGTDHKSEHDRLSVTAFLEAIQSERDSTPPRPLCRDPRSPDVFFIPEDILFDPKMVKEPNASRVRRETIAKKICNLCKLQAQCLEVLQSLDSEIYDLSGVWGGLTEQERKNGAKPYKPKT